MALVLRLTRVRRPRSAASSRCGCCPRALGGPLAAACASTWDRRKTMLAMDIARAGMIALVPLIARLLVDLRAGRSSSRSRASCSCPARDASIPDLVDDDDLPVANGLVLGSSYGTIPLGAAVVRARRRAAGQRHCSAARSRSCSGSTPPRSSCRPCCIRAAHDARAHRPPGVDAVPARAACASATRSDPARARGHARDGRGRARVSARCSRSASCSSARCSTRATPSSVCSSRCSVSARSVGLALLAAAARPRAARARRGSACSRSASIVAVFSLAARRGSRSWARSRSARRRRSRSRRAWARSSRSSTGRPRVLAFAAFHVVIRCGLALAGDRGRAWPASWSAPCTGRSSARSSRHASCCSARDVLGVCLERESRVRRRDASAAAAGAEAAMTVADRDRQRGRAARRARRRARHRGRPDVAHDRRRSRCRRATSRSTSSSTQPDVTTSGPTPGEFDSRDQGALRRRDDGVVVLHDRVDDEQHATKPRSLGARAVGGAVRVVDTDDGRGRAGARRARRRRGGRAAGRRSTRSRRPQQGDRAGAARRDAAEPRPPRAQRPRPGHRGLGRTRLGIAPLFEFRDGERARAAARARRATPRRADRRALASRRASAGARCTSPRCTPHAPDAATAPRPRRREPVEPATSFVGEFGTVMVVHTGPGLVGLAWWWDDRFEPSLREGRRAARSGTTRRADAKRHVARAPARRSRGSVDARARTRDPCRRRRSKLPAGRGVGRVRASCSRRGVG